MTAVAYLEDSVVDQLRLVMALLTVVLVVYVAWHVYCVRNRGHQEGIAASALGFDSVFTGANQLSAHRSGMLGSAEAPVFWNSEYAPVDAKGGVRGSGLRDDVRPVPDVAEADKADQAGYALSNREGAVNNLQKALLGM